MFKRGKHEVLTILRKTKRKPKIEEFVKGNCNFQYFERNDVLFSSNIDWNKQQKQVDSARNISASETRNFSNSVQKLPPGIPILTRS